MKRDVTWCLAATAVFAACSRTPLEVDDPTLGVGGSAGFGGTDDDAGSGHGGASVGGSTNKGGSGGGVGGVGGFAGVGGSTGGGRGGVAGIGGGIGGSTTSGGSGGGTAGRGGAGGFGAAGAGGSGGMAAGGTGGFSGRGGTGGFGGLGGGGAGGFGGFAGTGGFGGLGGFGGFAGTGGFGGLGGFGGFAGTGGFAGVGGMGGLGGIAGAGGGAIDAGSPSSCGNAIAEPGEECDFGIKNNDRPAFALTRFPTLIVSPVVPIDRVVSATTFYGLSSSSSHTGLELVSTSRIYLYRDTTTGILSLVMHHGIDRNTSGQSQPSGHVVFDIGPLPVTTVVAVTDDSPTEFFKSSPTEARGVWDFQNNSDGGVLSGLPMPASWSVTIVPDFQQGIASWQYVDGSLGTVELPLSSPVMITAFDSASFCRTNCTVPRCGDGILDGGEICDDGNVAGGDGCSADCKALR